MNLHNIRIRTSRMWIWYGVESRTTWREVGKHLFSPDPEQDFHQVDEWNGIGGRPEAALCGYRPRANSMRLNSYSYRFRCDECRRISRERDIIEHTQDEAIRTLRNESQW